MDDYARQERIREDAEWRREHAVAGKAFKWGFFGVIGAAVGLAVATPLIVILYLFFVGFIYGLAGGLS